MANRLVMMMLGDKESMKKYQWNFFFAIFNCKKPMLTGLLKFHGEIEYCGEKVGDVFKPY